MTLFGDQAFPAAPAPAPVIEGPTVRVRLDLAYLGTGFHGFAVQPGIHTVGGTLVAALERHLRHTVELVCAGRTDAGVHAWGQVVTFDARFTVDLLALTRALNRTLRPAIVIRSSAVVGADFDARRSATGRTYRYTINNGPPDPFSAATAWHVDRPLDLALLRLACDPLIGEHDFGSFCRKPPSAGGSLVRVVRRASWVATGSRLMFEIEASSFCQQMVRALVGTMVDMGVGKMRSGEMATILRAKNRDAAGQLAPPHGLCLWEVGYSV